MVIVVDDLGLSFNSMYFARRALRHFIDVEMQPGDLVALWETGRGNSVFQQLTSDKRVLDAAVDSLRWNPLGQGLLDAFQDTEDAQGQHAPGEFQRPNQLPQIHTRGEADERAYLSSGLVSGTLDTLEELIQELRTVGGRKAVVLFSDGMSTEMPSLTENAAGSPFFQALQNQMRGLIDNANRSGVVLYTIDARGLQYVPPGMRMRIAASQQPLITLAEETGGFASINNNGLAEALGRIREDQQGYYLIGFKAPDNLSTSPGGKRLDFHSLHVRLKRSGLHIRSRAGFWGETDEAARTEYKTPQAQMRLAAFSLFNRADIHVRLAALYTRTSDGQPAVRNLLYIDARDISFKTNAAGRHAANLDVLIMASASGLDSIAPVSRRVEMAVNDDQLEQLRRKGIVLTMNIPLKHSGTYQVRASVRDGNSAAIGSAGQFLEIPDLKKVHLALTTPIVEEAAAGGKVDDTSVVLREFHAGSNISFVSMLETDRDRAAKRPASDFDATLQLYSENKPILTTPVPVDDVRGRNVHAIKAELRLNNSLPPGQYYLKATATDHRGEIGRSARQWLHYRLERFPDPSLTLAFSPRCACYMSHYEQQPGAQQPAGFVARMKAPMNLPATIGAIASTSTPCPVRNWRASSIS